MTDDVADWPVYELESQLPSAEYVAFLEELHDLRPDVYALSAGWHARAMVFEYLAQGQTAQVDRVVMRLAGEMKEIGDAFFSLTSTIRLAGRSEAAQALIDAAVKQLEGSSLMYWAVDEVIDWAMFAHYQRCVAKGVTEAAVDALHVAAQEIGIEDSDQFQANRRMFALHLAGKSGKRWTKSELISRKKKALHNIYLLCVDYQRWLCEERRFKAIVADEFRRLVLSAIDGIDCPFNGLLNGLPQQRLDQYLAGKLGFMSLHRIAAPATVIAMKHYYDFLKELELVNAKPWQNSQAVCDCLWEQLKGVFDEGEWKAYTFLEEYLPGA